MLQNILFFDGKCSLCAHEIALLKRWKDARLVLVDIHSKESREIASDVSSTALLSVLHMKRADGSWLTGLDATVSAWRHTPFGVLFAPLRWPLIAPAADWLYRRWARKRARRLGYIGICDADDTAAGRCRY